MRCCFLLTNTNPKACTLNTQIHTKEETENKKSLNKKETNKKVRVEKNRRKCGQLHFEYGITIKSFCVCVCVCVVRKRCVLLCYVLLRARFFEKQQQQQQQKKITKNRWTKTVKTSHIQPNAYCVWMLHRLFAASLFSWSFAFVSCRRRRRYLYPELCSIVCIYWCCYFLCWLVSHLLYTLSQHLGFFTRSPNRYNDHLLGTFFIFTFRMTRYIHIYKHTGILSMHTWIYSCIQFDSKSYKFGNCACIPRTLIHFEMCWKIALFWDEKK